MTTTREAVATLLQQGLKPVQIAGKLGISASRVRLLRQKLGLATGATNTTSDATHGATNATTSVKDALHATRPEPMSGGELRGEAAQPRSLTPVERLAIACDAIEHYGVSRTAAYALAGIPPTSGRKRFLEDPKFRAAIELAEAEMERGPAANLRRLAMSSGPQAHIAAAIFLGRRKPGDWAERRNVEVDVKVEGGIDVRHVLRSPRLIELASATEAEYQRLDAEREARALVAHEDDAIDVDFNEVDLNEEKKS